jgi:hypothetical protein
MGQPIGQGGAPRINYQKAPIAGATSPRVIHNHNSDADSDSDDNGSDSDSSGGYNNADSSDGHPDDANDSDDNDDAEDDSGGDNGDDSSDDGDNDGDNNGNANGNANGADVVPLYATSQDFIANMVNHPLYTNQVSDVAGACSGAAQAIGPALTAAGYDISYRGIVLLAHPRLAPGLNLDRDAQYHLVANNLNHFVVVVHFNDGDVVLDPTQAQFANGAPQLDTHHAWRTTLRTLQIQQNGVTELCERRIVYLDAQNFDAANDFAGGEANRIRPYTHFTSQNGHIVVRAQSRLIGEGCCVLL